MGRKTRLTQTKNTATDEMEESLANKEIDEDGDQETTHLAENGADMGSDLEMISKEIWELNRNKR